MKKESLQSLLNLLEILAESILPLIFWVFLIFGFDVPYIAILTIISALIHESGHVAAISHFSGKCEIPSGKIFGFRIKRSGSLSYRGECTVLAAGPLANIIVFILTLPCAHMLDGYVGIFGLVNLATGISNLIPVEGYDGYGILSQILTSKNMTVGLRVIEGISFLFSVLATFLSLYLIDKADSGYWVFAVFFVVMITKLKKYGKYDVF